MVAYLSAGKPNWPNRDIAGMGVKVVTLDGGRA
jgi:hypothetical protein